MVFVEDQERMLHVKYNNKTMITIHNHNTITVTGRWVANYRLFEININNDIHILKIEKVKNSYLLKYSGMMAKCSVYPQHIAQLLHFMPKPTESSSKSYVESPISGMVVKVNVIKNDEVQAGQTLCIIEAMKMENAIQAEKKAKIKNVLIKEGDSVQSNDLIIEFYEEVSRKSNER